MADAVQKPLEKVKAPVEQEVSAEKKATVPPLATMNKKTQGPTTHPQLSSGNEGEVLVKVISQNKNWLTGTTFTASTTAQVVIIKDDGLKKSEKNIVSGKNDPL